MQRETRIELGVARIDQPATRERSALIIGGLAEIVGLQTAFTIATTLYLVCFIAMAARFRFLSAAMETAPDEAPRG